ncbi:DEAD/DEAH box helicase [Gordonia aichiensis]|uniref:DEAD/DEAH box helicase n=2 Tax=Gordonia TaxID=2053 RepID=UPI003262D2CA
MAYRPAAPQSWSWSSTHFQAALTAFDPMTCARGLDYAGRGMIVEFAATPTGFVGSCRGSGRRRYRCDVDATFEAGQLVEIDTYCSCPVGTFCKHCVALLVTAQREGSVPGRGQEWKALVTELRDLDEITARATRTRPEVPVGLMFELDRTYGSPCLVLRPVAPGKSRPWVMNRVTWDHVFGASSNENFAPAALNALRGLGQTLSTDRYGVPGVYGTVTLTGRPATWRALAGVREAGVPLVSRTNGAIGAAVLGEEVTPHLRVVPVAGGAAVEVELTLDARPLDPRATDVLDGDGIVVSMVDGALLVAPMPPLTPTETRLLRSAEPLFVPDDALPEFAAAMPAISGARAVEVVGGALEPQIVSGPALRLVITCDDTGADYAWFFDYTVNDAVRSVPVLDPSDGTFVRDDEGETKLLEGCRDELTAVAAATSAWLPTTTDRLEAATTELLRSGEVDTALAVRELITELRTRPFDETAAAAPPALLAGPVRLSLSEAAILCGEVAPRIEDAGRVTVTIEGDLDFRRAQSAPVVRFSGDAQTDWFDLAVELDVDGHLVPLASVIQALDAGETHMVLPDGTYFPLKSPELDRLQTLLTEARELGEIDRGRAASGTLNVSMWEDLLALGVVDDQLADWHGRIQRLARARPPHPVQPPAGLDAQLRHYQRSGLDWLTFLWDNRLGGILADDMGLGKTLQTLALFGRILEERPDARFLVVAPTSVIGNWAAEVRRFLPEVPVATVTATQKRLGPLAEMLGDVRIIVTSYTLLRIDYDNFAEFDWTVAVFDEAQFIKNHNSQTHQSARKLSAESKLAITGTPMENRVMELWSLVSVVAPGLFSSPKRFKEHFAAPIESGREPERLATLRRRLKPIMLRRTKDQVLDDLPEKQEQKLTLALEAKHRQIYDTFLTRERQRMLGLLADFDNNRIQILRALTTMRQLSLHPGLVDDANAEIKSTKITYLAEQVPELISEGHSALVFSSFTGFLKLVAARFDADGIAYSYLDGSMSARQRTAQIDDFTAGRTAVFLISLKAGGFGLNLTAADYCFVTDPWWNPAAESQAVDRAHRIGQKRAVTVYRMAAEDTIEEKVIALQDRKRELFNALIDDGAEFSGAITADDIRSLLR